MKGKVSQWKDDRGFGFILPDEGSEKLFFHISSVKTRARRPRIGDSVLYEPARDHQGRLRADAVVIEGVAAQSSSHGKSRHTQITPPKKNAFDYVLIFILLASLIGAGVIYLQSGNVEMTIPFGVAAVVAVILLNRQKKPKNKMFSCSRCHKVAVHDARTIKAWNNGFLKLYCNSCHHQWLNANPMQAHTHDSNRSGGCLGILALLAIVPIAAGVSVFQWITSSVT